MTPELKELLCEQWCSELEIGEDTAGLRLSLPLYEDDGDAITVWVKQTLGGWRLRDCGTTFMRLSYDMDVDLLSEGARARVVDRILADHQVRVEDGEIVCEVEERDLGAALFRFGQAMNRICDIKLWSRARVASTFYEDLRSTLIDLVGSDRLHIDYAVPRVEDANNYLVDYAVLGGVQPLYIFGVPTSDKAKLSTIIIQHLQQSGHSFASLIIPSDIESIRQPDLRRLMNAATSFVDSSTSREAIQRKILERL